MEHPGEVTKKIRKSKKMNIRTLAGLSGVDQGTISRFERGGNFHMRVFKSICKSLGMTVQDIYERLASVDPSRQQRCEDGDPEHEKYHSLLESILHSNDQKCINAIVAILEAVARNYPDRSTGGHSAIREVELFRAAEDQAPYNSSRTERQHGPFDTTKLPIPGVSEIEFKDPILKKKRK